MGLSLFERIKLIEQAKEAQENDQSLWPTKPFTGYEETIQNALRDLHLVIAEDKEALKRIIRKCGAV